MYSSDTVTSDNTPTFDVACTEIGSTINLYGDNPAANILIGTHACTAVGTESVAVAPAIIDGVHNITYIEEDLAGNESAASASLAITIDTVPPAAVTIISVGGDLSPSYDTGDTTPEIVVTTVIGDSVTIPGFVCVPTPAVSTSVTCSPSVAYTNKAQTVIVTVTDLAGNGPTTGSVSFNVIIPTSGGSGYVNFPQPANIVEEVLPETPHPTVSCLPQRSLSAPFTDIDGHFAESAILLLKDTMSNDFSIIQGYSDALGEKIFKPDQDVTRAEFLKMAMLSNCMSIEVWYLNHVYSALKAGIVDGEADGNFYPDRPITRAEAIKILVNIQGLIDENYSGTDYFSDVEDADWFFKYVSSDKENKLIFGYQNNEGDAVYKPFNNITRGETALILVRVFDLRDYATFADPNVENLTSL